MLALMTQMELYFTDHLGGIARGRGENMKRNIRNINVICMKGMKGINDDQGIIIEVDRLKDVDVKSISIKGTNIAGKSTAGTNIPGTSIGINMKSIQGQSNHHNIR